MDTIVSYTASKMQIWEAKSLAILAEFSVAAPTTRGVLVLPRFVVAAEAEKPLLSYFKFGREASERKSALIDRAAVLASNGEFMVGGSAGQDGLIYLWAMESGYLVCSWPGHFNGVTAITIDGNRLITAGNDGWVYTWLISRVVLGDTRPLERFSQHTRPVTDVCLRKDQIVTVSEDSTLAVMSGGAVISTENFPTVLRSVVSTSYPSYLYAAGDDGVLYEIDETFKRLETKLSEHAIIDLHLACAESLLVVGMQDAVVVLNRGDKTVLKRFSNQLDGPLIGFTVIDRPPALTDLEQGNLEIFTLSKTTSDISYRVPLLPLPEEESATVDATEVDQLKAINSNLYNFLVDHLM